MRKNLINAIALIVIAGTSIVACSVEKDEPIPIEPSKGVALKMKTSGIPSENYEHKGILTSEGKIVDVKSGKTLEAFAVEPADYDVYVTASTSEENLAFAGIEAAGNLSDAKIKISDISRQIPELMLGHSGIVTVGAEGAVAPIEVKRIVSSLDVTVDGLQNIDAQTISLTIAGMYDQVDLDGNLSKSGADFCSKTLTLTKDNDGKYKAHAIVMPTDASASTLDLTYNVKGTEYKSTPAGKFESNGQYQLNTSVDAGSVVTKVNLESSLSYAEWNTSVLLADSFVIDKTTPEASWIGPTIYPIGGGSSYDNFWASSSLGANNDGLLYDGDKTEWSHWIPDTGWDSTPCWYIDLGSAKQGISITYWNKAGGKGGQKIHKMDIYVSNNKASYGGGSEWTKLTTFTSDKTASKTDAGAEVGTGLIKFSEDGTSSYQYVKCAFPDKVDADGNITEEPRDVNVAELVIETWEYR